MSDKGDFVLAIENAYGWIMSKNDHEKLKNKAKDIGSGSRVIEMMRVWRDEIGDRPAPIDQFLKWKEWEVKKRNASNPHLDKQIPIW